MTNDKPASGAWEGKVARIGDVQAKVGCTSNAGVDASGATVAYDAGNLTDGVADTTWRCDGSAIGEKITLKLGKDVPIGDVGLIPGYAKTDEQTRADRFAENHRVTRVRWTIGDTEVIQKFSGAPEDRSLALVRVPRTTTDTVELEILAVAEGLATPRPSARSSWDARAEGLAAGPGQVSRTQLSRSSVTGPSLASSTVMSAPKTPRSTWVPRFSSPSQTAR